MTTDAPEKIWIDRGPNGGWMKRFERMPDSEHEYIRADVAQAMVAAAREDALREAAERIDRKIKQVQPEMTRRAQRLAEGKKPGFQYAIHRADLDARMSDRDMILALIPTSEGEA